MPSLAPRRRRPISWTSTDLDDDEKTAQNNATPASEVKTEVSIALPKRRHTAALPEVQVEESFTLKKPPRPPSAKETEDLTITRSDSLAERVRKMQLLKKQNSIERELRRQSSTEK